MKYYVTLHGEEFEVELVTDADGRVKARVEDREFVADVAVIEARRRYSILLGAQSHDVLAHRRGDRLTLQHRGRRLEARVEDQRQRAARRISAHLPKGPTTLTSAMPGIVREVRVAAGDRVEQGQALVILEAMKMENELCADQAGVVREVLVETGTAVESGAPLVVIEPPPS